MKNTPKGLKEELMKMRKLMDFDISENSHDVLSESNVEKSILSEQKRTRGWKIALKFWPDAKGFGSGGFYFKPR